MKRFFSLSLSLSLLCTLPSCSKNPVTGKRELSLISTSQEVAVGSKHYQPTIQLMGGPYVTHPQIQSYVEKIGHNLAKVSDRPNLPYEFTVLNESIPNAWAMPGGKIAITRGLLSELKSEAELAAVLGHEIVHAAARHYAKQRENALLIQTGIGVIGSIGSTDSQRVLDLVSSGADLITLQYSRNLELDADEYGTRYMIRAGYNPQGAIDLQTFFLSIQGRSNWVSGLFSTHPPSQKRIEALEEQLSGKTNQGFMGQERYSTVVAPLIKAEKAYDLFDQALKESNPERQIQLANEGLLIEPREAMGDFIIGLAHNKRKQTKESLTSFSKAINKNSNYFLFYLERGKVYLKLNRKEEAKSDFQKSFALLPTKEAQNYLNRL